MRIQCVHCGKQYSLRDENAGSQFACRSCGKISPIAPAASTETEPAAEASAAPAAALVETQCLHCGKQYKLRPQAAGMQFKCKQCGQFSPVGASPQPPKKSIPQAQPRIARVVQPAKPRPTTSVEPLAAIPIGPPAAVPVKPPAAAPLAAIPLDPAPTGAPEMLELFDEPNTPAAVSPFGAQEFGVARPAVRMPPPLGGKKKVQRKSGGDGQAAVVLRILGGAALMAVGVGIAILGLYGLHDDGHGTRRPVKVIVLGVCCMGSGFKLMLGWNKAN